MESTNGMFLTFDVELFFGSKSGSVTNCILEPTQQILNVMNEHKKKGTFFIDAGMLVFFNENGLNSELDALNKLIDLMLLNDHEVGLHVHPHWMDASYFNGNYIFNSYSNYSIGNLGKEAEAYYEYVINYFSRLLGAKRFTSHRSGGFCCQPFSLIKNVLHKNGIKIDSSVVPGLSVSNPVFDFNFENLNYNKPYRFSDDVSDANSSGEMVEVPVTSYVINGYERIYNKCLRTLDRNVRFGDGLGLRFHNSQNFLKRISPTRKFLSLDDDSYCKIIKIYKRTGYANIVSHPKNFSKANLKLLSRLCANDSILFKRISDIVI